ncbi:MAG: HU family DNA-binding protein [Oscillospiraceae bacterium]|nr:HU family DNA-binding protein [Oscillospiraceae bacterium]
MTKTEFVDKIAEESGITKKDADASVKAAIKVLTDAMAAGDKIAFPGFGSFEVRERAAREGKNPRTGEAVQIAACKSPAFKAGKALKDAVNK